MDEGGIQIFTDKAKVEALPDIVLVGAAEQQTPLPGCPWHVPGAETDPANPRVGSKAFVVGLISKHLV